MPANLLELIQTLEAQRTQHAQASSAIAATLEQLSGMLGALVGGQRATNSVAAPSRAPRSAAATAPAAKSDTGTKGRRKRKTFATTGQESVLAFVRAKNNPTSAEIRKHWESEGRGGSAHDILSILVGAKKIKREPLKGQPGSRYKIT